MKIIQSKLIPPKGFIMLNILGFVFLRAGHKWPTAEELRHEAIHTAQQHELLTISALAALLLCGIWQTWWYLLAVLVLPFVIYAAAFVIELVMPPYHGSTSFRQLWMHAYLDNCFEREAHGNKHNEDYLAQRPPFAELLYIVPRKRD